MASLWLELHALLERPGVRRLSWLARALSRAELALGLRSKPLKVPSGYAAGTEAWWRADAWAETILDRQALLRGTLYELFPPMVSGPLCWLLEGQASAQNRYLLPMRGERRLIVQTLMTLPSWVMMLVWLVAQPPEVSFLEVSIPFMVLAWRAVCIAMKYAYFSPSDLVRLQGSVHWSRTAHNTRQLGAHRYFNIAGTLAFDRMESLFKTSLRTQMLEEARDGFIAVEPKVAENIWEQVREELEPAYVDTLHCKYVPGAPQWRSKYGNVQELLGLWDLSAIEARIAAGELPVTVLAYHFVQTGSPASSPVIFAGIFLLGMTLGFLHPLALHIAGDPAFGVTAAGKAVLGLRTFHMMLVLAPVFLYFSFPVLDGMRRGDMALALLAAFGRGEARAERLAKDGVEDPVFHIKSERDLRAFWCLCRLLGPVHEIGLVFRYNSAFMAVHIAFLCIATGGLVASSWLGDVAWGVTAELIALFGSGAAAVFTASILSVLTNDAVALLVGRARQAALEHPELGELAQDICSNLHEEHTVLNPVRILYMPATPALLSLLWSGLLVLTTLFISAIPSVCVPFFSFGRACLN